MNVTKSLLIGILLTILIPNQVFSCNCKVQRSLDSLRQLSFHQADMVFLGELIDYDTTNYTFTFKIIELFKGSAKSVTIKGKLFDSCSLFPRDKCKWIVYANIHENGFINIDHCLASRSELNPNHILLYAIPPPLCSLPTEDEINKSLQITSQIKEGAYKDWLKEIEMLRNHYFN